MFKQLRSGSLFLVLSLLSLHWVPSFAQEEHAAKPAPMPRLEKARTSLRPPSPNDSVIMQAATAKTVRVLHTTRSAPPQFTEKPTVPGFTVFPAGRYGATFTNLVDGKEIKTYLVFQTESGEASHLQPVDPGKTKVSGFVAKSDSAEFKESSRFSENDVRGLLIQLLRAWGAPDKITDSDKKLILNSIGAIYAEGDAEKLKKALELGKPINP
jgi:hypothetical protein